jgi:glycosyltransferase involved in cell wall biosynthesis
MRDLLFITGSYPPDACGMAYGSAMLMKTGIANQKWQLYYSTNWAWNTLFKHIKKIKESQMKYILMQFPTRSYGWSIVPHLLCLYFSWFTRKRFGVIIHEQMQQSRRAYIAELLIIISANRLIFTNRFERNFAIKKIPFTEKRSTVIKIFSQINAVDKIYPILKRSIDIINFGLIWPKKGIIEQFITDTAYLTPIHKVVIAGMVPSGFEVYYAKIEKLCKEAGIEIKLNLNDEEIAELLNNCKLAYLPYPDGISERRGSALAAMSNGTVIVSNLGMFTTPELANAIIDVSCISLEDILKNEKLLTDKQNDALHYIKTVSRSIEEIATDYDEFMKYESKK